MTHHARLNLIMLASLAGLAVFLYIVPRSDETPIFRISSLQAEAVQQIQIMRADSEMMLQKSEDQWFMTSPMTARANTQKVSDLLDLLSATSEYKIELTALERFGLDKPSIRLLVDNEFFDFGMLTPVTNQQYIATNHGVYLISPRYSVMLLTKPARLVSPALFGKDEIPVGFELDDVTILQREGAWVVNRELPSLQLNQDEISSWVKQWQQAVASNVLSDEEILQIDDKVITQKKVKISLQSGQTKRFNTTQYESNVVLISDEISIHYLFSGPQGQLLLDPLNQNKSIDAKSEN